MSNDDRAHPPHASHPASPSGATHADAGRHKPEGVEFDLRALLEGPGSDPLDLLDRHVNPALASVLRTIGFDAKFVRGEGAYLFDDKGRRYIDCLGGYAVFNCGRNHPVVRDALRQALDLDLPNLPGVGTFRVGGLLAKELLAVMPGADSAPPDQRLSKVFFANGGAEAVDAAIKFARAATGRARIIHCARSYHGLTFGGLSVNGNREFRDGFGPLLPDVTDIAFDDLGALERALVEGGDGSRGPAAALIVEPIQGKGVHVPSAGYLREASRLCARHGTLLILDEIQTGLGRTGRVLACEHDGAGTEWQPDMVVLAKGLSGGYVPVSAVVMKEWIHRRTFSSMEQCARVQTTYGMNDLAMVAGLAALHVMRHERIPERAGRVGERLMAGLREMVGRHEMVKEVRGRGLMVGIEFHRPRGAGLRMGWDLLHRLDPSLFCQAVIMPLMSDHRIIAQVAAHRSDVIKLIPPLVLSAAEADEIVGAMEACVGACHRFPGPAWEVGKKLTTAAARRLAPA